MFSLRRFEFFVGVFLGIFILGFIFAKEGNRGNTNVLSSTTTACDQSLWNHIYHPNRLHIIEPCETVSGTIDAAKAEPDGDYHIRLKLDDAFANLINDKNTQEQHGDLVLEPVCEHEVTQADAIDVCSNFRGDVVIPSVGTHVEVTGSYVLDADHGWNEIHPITRLTVLP